MLALRHLQRRFPAFAARPSTGACRQANSDSAHLPERGSCGRLLRVLSAWLLSMGLACVTATPIAPIAPIEQGSTPSTTDLAEAPHPALAQDDVQDAESVPPPGQAPLENESLRFARAVLERKGSKKLDAAQREGVARALASGEEEHGLSVVVSLAIIEQESRFDPDAQGPAGSIGLMQLQPATAREVAKRTGLVWQSDRTLLDPEQNARLGIAYLAELRGRFGSTDHAIAAYNIGPGNLRRLLARRALSPGPYLKKVHAHIDALREEYSE